MRFSVFYIEANIFMLCINHWVINYFNSTVTYCQRLHKQENSDWFKYRYSWLSLSHFMFLNKSERESNTNICEVQYCKLYFPLKGEKCVCSLLSTADALKKDTGLQLVGPYDILAGNHTGVDRNRHGKRPNFLLHWRYYYDPPEFQTVLKGDDKTQFHLGYFRYPSMSLLVL